MRVQIEDDKGHWQNVTMFSNTLSKVIEADGGTAGTVKRSLLMLPKIVFKVNTKDVVTEVEKYCSTWREDAAQ